ncbi:MAG: undecaprenyl/decaprenyl-phosphate alpha-N-acetylglucosaminyl 1-phosphate transferase [Sulfurovum sp.]|nr:undecaprenyl/decaprenyl-phosphate alpha-N-acetylglucosaminyl 1-phosphate transferase [Sulfurovum sp.]
MILLLTTIFTFSVGSIFLVMKYADKLGLVDVPNERSMHKNIVPRGAGLAFVSSVFIILAVFDFEYLLKYYYIYLAIAIVFIAGLWDDYKDISPKIKFIFIFLSSVLLYINDIAIFNLGTYFGYEFILPSWFVFPFTFFAIAGYTNALNLMDGLDGLASSLSIVIFSAFLAIGLEHKDELLISLSSFFIVTLLAFLLFNRNPAKIFMGDSGSLALGMVIVILSIKALQYITPASVLFIIALPILDTFIVMTRRIQRGLSPFKADKNHMHHFLYNIKGDVRYTVMILVVMQIIFSLIGYQVSDANNLISLVLFALLFYIYLTLFDQRLKRRKKVKKSKKKKQNKNK